MMLRWLLPLLGGLPIFGATGKDTEALSISFNDHVRPILADKCYACHGPDPEDRAADLRLDTEEGAFADLGGYRAITPGDPEESEIFWRIEATFKVRYRSAAEEVTKNACFCFGPSSTNNDLYKAGTLIGMGKHGIFEGAWGNVAQGISMNAGFKADDLFEAIITIDLEHGMVTIRVGETTIEQKLPASLEQVSYVGIYAKNTQSEFSKIERVK